MYAIIFYILSAVILSATAMAVTRRNLVHAVLYLVISFLGSAMLLYMFGAPFLAATEVIIYAGAIMILFLFIIMMIDFDHLPGRLFPVGRLVPALIMAGAFVAVGAVMIIMDADLFTQLRPAVASPRRFGQYVLQRHWLMVEVVSLLLLAALAGALLLGRSRIDPPAQDQEEVA